MKDVDGLFDYRIDVFSGRQSTCRLRVYVIAGNIAVVIASEVTENRGPSVTNSAEALARQAVIEYDLDVSKTIFIEHYDHRAESVSDTIDAMRYANGLEDETFDYVEFQWRDGHASSPKWRRASKKEIETLIGEKLS